MQRLSATEKEYIRRINLALQYVESHLGEEIPLATLAGIAFFSPFHFHRIFSAIMGESPADYVRRLRLERAAQRLLSNPWEPVTSIALGCGFSSSSLFSRLFRQRFGASPVAFRNGELPDSKKSKTLRKKKKELPSLFWYSQSRSDYQTRRKTMEHELKGVKVEVKKLPVRKVAYVLHRNGYDDAKGICRAYEKLFAWAGPRGLMTVDTNCIGVSPDNPDITPKDKCRHYACIQVADDVRPEGEVGVMALAGGTYAVGRFEGKDEIFKKAYDYMYGFWLPKNGYQPTDNPAFEIYIVTPEDHPKGHYVFDLHVPVKPL